MNMRVFVLVASLIPSFLGTFHLKVSNHALIPFLQIDETQVITNQALVSYPEKVTFRLELDPAVNIVDATLTYDVEQVSCLEVSTQVPVAGEGPVFEWEWVMIRSGNPPPGATVWWQWTLTDDQGQTFTTSREELTLSDDRFQWQTVSEGNITVHWYAGEDVGPMLLEAAVEGLHLLEEDLGIELQETVEFYIYGSPEEMRDAVLYIQDWAGGVAFSEHNTILMGVQPAIAEDWGRNTVRHELAHLVTGQYGRSCVGGHRPSWLEEGLAMYAEGASSDKLDEDLNEAIRENSFIPLRSLNGAFPAHGDDAGAAYSQSYSVIRFLREEYGQESIQALILLLAEGKGYDAALEQVYGLNVDGLEQAWRAWIGAPARPAPPTPTPISALAIPTLEPLARPSNMLTPTAFVHVQNDQPDTQPDAGLCVFGLLPLAAITVFTLRTRKRGL